MKVVNLSRRPFLNRRPVIRAAIILWIAGGLVLLANVWLYTGHFRGSSAESEKLALVARQIDSELERLDRYGEQLKAVRLGRSNARARALNRLIHKRTFPWSGLFDDLERVLPADVFLEGVSPEIQKDEPTRSRTRRRSLTPAEARRLARARARGEAVETPDDATAEAEAAALEEAKQDRVRLNLNATAKSEDAMFELVTNLYEDPSFEEPFLGRESAENPGQVRFSVRVVYRTRASADEPTSTTLAEADVDAEGVDVEAAGAVEISEGDGDTAAAAERRADAMSEGAPPAEGTVAETLAAQPGQRPVTNPRYDPGSRRQLSEGEMAERQAMAERTREEAVRQRAGEGEGDATVLGVPRTAPPTAGTPSRTSSSRVSVAPRTRERETTRAPEAGSATERRTVDRRTAETEPPATTRPAASATPRLRRNR